MLALKYGKYFGIIMLASKRALFLVSIMLLSPLASAIQTEDKSQSIDLAEVASNWRVIEPIDTFESGLKPVDYNIYFQSASFDPVNDEIPKSNFDKSNDYLDTGMALIQFHDHTQITFDNVVKKFNLFILDNLGSSTWLVRLQSPSDLMKIQHEEEVRWAGQMMPGWRISNEIDSQTEYIAAIPAPDLKEDALDGLASDLVLKGADEVWCGLHLCEIKGAVDINYLAQDGRIIWSQPTVDLRLTNAVAGAIVGIPAVLNSSLGLDGSGEKISFIDTGIDQDHPDIFGRVAGVYTQFGLDPSPADSNSGHGTHVAITLAGDGSGSSDGKGIAPGAYIVAYALEHDPSGAFGRLGSIYDMLKHAEQEGSRVSVNAWGLNGYYGQYTPDSRTVDIFVKDNPELLPIFTAGDDVNQQSSKVMAPSTAKNALSIGASTTNPSGSVANFSANGLSVDGRIKPDLVAPGVMICSGRAQEAAIALGGSCGSGTHANGNGMYMTLSGTSQATAVAGGSISLIREFIREEVGISSPSASLLKAASINGAIDLGAPDIPNGVEGWGQISVSNSVMPMNDGNQLQTYFENYRVISAGFSMLYQFDLNPNSGLDITLAWTDIAGSANEDQNISKLVNDLDLELISPSGVVFKGNVFTSGESIPNGVSDSLNNVERIKFYPNNTLNSGKWQVKVSHKGGLDQSFSLVVTGDATIDMKSDLTTFDGSIYSSSESPLVDDLIVLRLSWLNQGNTDTGQFRVILEDLTEGTTLFDGLRPSVGPGEIDSFNLYHSFDSTGDHDLRLSVDVNDDVTEINDENNGINNNVKQTTIVVSALGVRLVALDENGQENSDYVNQSINPNQAEGYTWPVVLKHEGTGNQSVSLHISQVQSPSPLRDDVLLPTIDTWSKYSDQSGPFVLSPMGEEGDKLYLNITMNDDDADLSGQTPRFAMAGTFVMDVTAKYSNNPAVKHVIRLRLVVEEVKDAQVAPAGTSGLEAQPGGFTSFSISVRNVGNSPAIYDLDCFSENRWQVQLGQSNSSSYSFEALDILEYLPMQVRLYVPSVNNGTPIAGSTDSISCYVTSEADPSLNISETVLLTVKALESFETHLFDQRGVPVGPSSTARDVNVENSERLNLTLDIKNTGNAQLSLIVRISPELTTWTLQVHHDEETKSREVEVILQPGEQSSIKIEVLVSPVAERNDENHLSIKISQSPSNFIINQTTMVVRDELSISINNPNDDRLDVNVNGDFSYTTLKIENTGNSPISISWSNSIAPDGWEIGFSNPPSYLEPREEVNLEIGIKPPVNQPAIENAFELGIYASIDNTYDTLQVSQNYIIRVLESSECQIEYDESIKPLLGIKRGETSSQDIVVTNVGNVPLDAVFGLGTDASDWNLDLDTDSVSGLVPGASESVTISVTSEEKTKAGKENLLFSCGNSTVSLDMSVQNTQTQGGLFGVLPPAVAYSIVGAILLIVVVIGYRVKRSSPKDYSGEELVSPDAHVIPDDGKRMRDVMDSVVGQESLASGAVSADEIAQALASSMPSLPPAPAPATIPQGRPPSAVPAGTPPSVVPMGRPPAPTLQSQPVQGPPLPPGGLPPGWTMEQWQYYGHQWLSQQGQQ